MSGAMTTDDVPLETVLCFRAGEASLAIDAHVVAALVVDDPTLPHVAALLGLPEGDGGDCRVVVIADDESPTLIRVDTPLVFRPLPAERRLAPPAAAHRLPGIAGYFEDGDRVALILDPAELVARARAHDPPPSSDPFRDDGDRTC